MPTPFAWPEPDAAAGREFFWTTCQARSCCSKPLRHPTTCGKVERFQQTLKKWLPAQPDQPKTIAGLQALLDRFRTEYNQQRPHRSLPHWATPAALYGTMPKAVPGPGRDADTHNRIRHDRDSSPEPSPCASIGQLRHIGVGRTRQGIILLVQDLDVRVVDAITGELLRELTIDTTRDYQPRTPKWRTPEPTFPWVQASGMS